MPGKDHQPAMHINYAIITTRLQPGIVVVMMFVVVLIKLVTAPDQTTLVRQLASEAPDTPTILGIVATPSIRDSEDSNDAASLPVESIESATARSLKHLQSQYQGRSVDQVTLQIPVQDSELQTGEAGMPEHQLMEVVSRQIGTQEMQVTLSVGQEKDLDHAAQLADRMKSDGSLSDRQLSLGLDQSIAPDTVRVEISRLAEQTEGQGTVR